MFFNAALRTAVVSAVVVTGAATTTAQTSTTTQAPTATRFSRVAPELGGDFQTTTTNPIGDPDCMRNGRSPASLLLFPEYDNRFGKNTLLTITNTDTDLTHDDVRVTLWYIDSADCLKDDFTVTLTPGDTITLLTRAQNPNEGRGFVYAYAVSPGGMPITRNVLIGQEIYIDGVGLGALDWSINAVGFKGRTADGTNTDIDFGPNAGDGNRDLNGDEYDSAPARIHIPRFLGQDLFSNSTMTFIGLSGGTEFTTILDFAIYNDNEEMFSRTFQFACWTKVRLVDISNVFTNGYLQSTNDDPNEILGSPGLEAGWFTFQGLNAFSTSRNIAFPAVYGVLVEDRGNERVSDLPWDEGCRNGSLLPTGPNGDNSDNP